MLREYFIQREHGHLLTKMGFMASSHMISFGPPGSEGHAP